MANPAMVDLMRRAGFRLELHGDHFKDDEDDDVWIRAVSEKNWVILTADKRVEKDHLESIINAFGRLVLLTDNSSGWVQWTGALIAAHDKLIERIQADAPPIIIRLSKSGAITKVRLKGELESTRSRQIARSKRERGQS